MPTHRPTAGPSKRELKQQQRREAAQQLARHQQQKPSVVDAAKQLLQVRAGIENGADSTQGALQHVLLEMGGSAFDV